MSNPALKTGIASMKKKAADKLKVQEPDQKAIDSAVFIETTEMFGSRWNRFEDKRGWTWVQEERT